MKIFNYSKCDTCMKFRNDTKIELYKMFPVEICERIGDCNVYCTECSSVRCREVDFLKTNLENTRMSKTERQILFFKIENDHPFYARDSRKVKVQKMNRVLDNADPELKKVMKSYFNVAFRYLSRDVIPNLAYKESLREEVKDYHKEFFPYYNQHYNEAILIKMILYEYLLALMGDDLRFIELEDIHEYLDDIFKK